jgi:O-antigen ligase
MMAAFSVQSAMTFSRGGLYAAGFASALTAAAMLPDRTVRARLSWMIPAVALIAVFIVAPRLNEFTGGAIATRYEDPDLTHRDSLVLTDIQAWEENFFFGLGPGNAKAVRGNAAHTEFSRLLSEHGLLGLGALLLLLLMVLEAVQRARDPWERAVTLSFVCWSLLFMAIYAMRVAAPAFFFGLSFAPFLRLPAPERRALQPSLQAMPRWRVPAL